MNTSNSKTQSKQQPSSSAWNYQPHLPVGISPLFIWPLNFLKIVKWFWRSWFPLSERLLILCLAGLSWFYLHPSLEQTKTLQLDWISLIVIRNLALMIVVAGGLHLYFYTFRRQKNHYQFDKKPFPVKNKKFTFSNQLYDNIFWTCTSGVGIWSAYEILLMWAMANGYAPVLNWSDNPVWFVLLFFLIPIWESFYFYWIHRLLHWPPLYKYIHSLHHKNTNVGPWSGLSMHPVEHLMFLGSVLIHFIVPSNPLHIIYHLQFYALSSPTTHSGFNGLYIQDKNVLPLGTYHHQLHHRYFECNYGSLELPFDSWFGTFHNGTAESHKIFKEKRVQALINRKNKTA